MASYTFKWEHPEANEVFVTGTFDDWGKTEKLDRKGDFFEKNVQLPNKDKILYKFVVDGNWTVNSHLPQETDEHNNVNNVLHPHQLGVSILSSAAPVATTAVLAGAVPKESQKAVERSVLPGSFPETPATESSTFNIDPIPATGGAGNPIQLEPGEKVPDAKILAKNTISSSVGSDEPAAFSPGEKVPDPSTLTKNTIHSTIGSDEPAAFSVNPIPATEGAGNPIHLEPGEKVPDPSTLTKNTIQSTIESDEPAAFSVNPIPATESAGNPIHLAPGEKVPDPSTFTSNTIQSAVSSDDSDTFGVAPLPATAGIGNPIDLAPGEKVPESSSITANTLTSNVHTDKESYEKADATPSIAPASGTPKDIASGALSLPPINKNMIPESSLPMGSGALGETDPAALIQSAAPISTTAFLAGQVPLERTAASSAEPDVPEIVTDSQEAAKASPEASANPKAVEEKKELEEELKAKVPEQPPTSQSDPLTSQKHDAIIGDVAVVGTTSAGAAVIVHKHATIGATERAKSLESTSITNSFGTGSLVPNVVQESIAKAHESPEATISTAAVEEKHAVEADLLSKIKPVEATPSTLEATGEVPKVVKESIAKAHVNPEATTSAEAVEEKDAVEAELLKKIKPVTAVGEPAPIFTAETPAMAPGASGAASGMSSNALSSSAPLKSLSELEGLSAPAPTPAVTEATQENTKAEVVSPVEPVKNGGPTVISGLSTFPAAAPITGAGPATPKKETAPRPSTVTTPTGSDIATPDSKAEKKKKRRSIFNKLKKIFD